MAVWHLLALSKGSGRGGGRPPFFAPFLAKSGQPRCGTPGLCTEAANSVVKPGRTLQKPRNGFDSTVPFRLTSITHDMQTHKRVEDTEKIKNKFFKIKHWFKTVFSLKPVLLV